MTTIKEDYCSQEVYRLLIEKGFDGEVHTTFDEEGYTKPSITLQMAMKWLRKNYNICITIYPDKEKGYEAVLYDIKNNVEIVLQSFGIYGFHIFGDSYEEACEAAIKYCLENLI